MSPAVVASHQALLSGLVPNLTGIWRKHYQGSTAVASAQYKHASYMSQIVQLSSLVLVAFELLHQASNSTLS